MLFHTFNLTFTFIFTDKSCAVKSLFKNSSSAFTLAEMIFYWHSLDSVSIHNNSISSLLENSVCKNLTNLNESCFHEQWCFCLISDIHKSLSLTKSQKKYLQSEDIRNLIVHCRYNVNSYLEHMINLNDYYDDMKINLQLNHFQVII